MKIKMTIEKDTTLNFSVWQENGWIVYQRTIPSFMLRSFRSRVQKGPRSDNRVVLRKSGR